jgi:predicted nucleic acid-binding Zn ribbon protein
MVFQAIPSKFSCATFQKLSTTSHFVPLFLAHEDVMVGFVIFHTKLSTPRLACFICSSLILQGSWSDHCNLKKERKRKEKGTPPWFVKVGGHPMESVIHGLRKEKVGRSAKL